MPLNKFGQSAIASKNASLISKFQPLNNQLKYTIHGDLDLENIKICNIKDPSLDGDAVNKKYVDVKDNIYSNLIEKIEKKIDNLEQSVTKNWIIYTNKIDENTSLYEEKLKKYNLDFEKMLNDKCSDLEKGLTFRIVKNKTLNDGKYEKINDSVVEISNTVNTIEQSLNYKMMENQRLIDDKWEKLMNEKLGERIKALEEASLKRKKSNSLENKQKDDVKKVRLTPCPEGKLLDLKNQESVEKSINSFKF